MPRAATTLIFVGTERIARLDLGDTPGMATLFAWQSARQPGQSPEQAVEATLDRNVRCGRSVWVLCEDLWSQKLSLAEAAVRGLGDVQLERVLGFELESLSGLSPGESRVAFVPCQADDGQPASLGQPAQRSYLVTQATAGDLQQIDKLIRQAGGRLRGLLHPGGLGSATAGNPPIGQPQSPGQGLAGESLDLQLALWAKALAESENSVPIIRPVEPPRSAAWPAGVAIGLAVAALAACIAHGAWMKQQSAQTAIELRAAQLPRQQLVQLDRALGSARDELAKLAAKRAKRASVDPTAALAEQRQRLAAMLAALGGLADDDRVVTAIKPDPATPGGQIVEGLCLAAESADDLAVGLGRRLAGTGWQVHAAQKAARLLSDDGGPWEFRISLIPARSTPTSQPGGNVAQPPSIVRAQPVTLRPAMSDARAAGQAQGGEP